MHGNEKLVGVGGWLDGGARRRGRSVDAQKRWLQCCMLADVVDSDDGEVVQMLDMGVLSGSRMV